MLMLKLQQSGLIAGFCGEPNPAHPELSEALVDSDDPGLVIRWRGKTVASAIVSETTGNCWRSLEWFKAGFLPDMREKNSDPFAPEQERTLLVRRDETGKVEPMTPDQERVFAAASEPLQFSESRTPWEIIGECANVSADVARDAIVSLVLSRRWRRFALRAGTAMPGQKRGGLACWKIGDQVERAAAAAAGISATGDVAVRKPTDEWPFDLSVLIPPPAEGTSEKIARGIASKWGMEPGRWVSL